MGNEIQALTALNQRVWYVEGGVHPTRPPQFLALGKFSDDPAQNIGEETRISAPDPNHFQRDIQIGSVPGEVERATFGIGVRTTTQKSILLDWKNKRCRIDFFALSGRCGNPQDFTEGGEFWTYFPDGKLSGHSFENFGGFGTDENSPTNEMVDCTSEEYYQFLYMRQEQIASSLTTREIYTVDVYKGDACDDCPDPCDNVFLTMAGASATPGTKPTLFYSQDGGTTFSQQIISALFSNESISDGEVIGNDYVLISNGAGGLVYTDISMLYDGTNEWQRVTTGFVASKAPNAMSSADVRHTWIVGNGGYVYFAKNHRTGVEVQDAGIATTQHLRSVHAMNSKNVLAVGDSNAVIYTVNGGQTWESVTGPSVGINMGACWMWDAKTWFVLEGANGNGKAWLTTNSGKSWSLVALPSSYLRFDKIKFISEAEGYISARSGGQSYILRTITAGAEWVVLPSGKSGVAIDNAYLSDIAVCSKYANTVYAAGLGESSAGIALRMTA